MYNSIFQGIFQGIFGVHPVYLYNLYICERTIELDWRRFGLLAHLRMKKQKPLTITIFFHQTAQPYKDFCGKRHRLSLSNVQLKISDLFNVYSYIAQMDISHNETRIITITYSRSLNLQAYTTDIIILLQRPYNTDIR